MDQHIFITNRTRELQAGKVPFATAYLQANEEWEHQHAEQQSAPTLNRQRQAPDHTAIMNRARQLAGGNHPTAANIIAAQRELGCAPSDVKLAVQNRSASQERPARQTPQPDTAAITNRALSLQAANPKLSLPTAFRMAQNETGAAPSGTIRNRAADTPAMVKALCGMIYLTGTKANLNFDTAWDQTLRAHPALFEAAGIDLPDSDDTANQ